MNKQNHAKGDDKKMDELKVGDNVIIIGDECGEKGKLATIVKVEGIYAESNLCNALHPSNSTFKKLKIEFAKSELRSITDNLNELDRQIKALEERKKPYLDKIKMFS